MAKVRAGKAPTEGAFYNPSDIIGIRDHYNYDLKENYRNYYLQPAELDLNKLNLPKEIVQRYISKKDFNQVFTHSKNALKLMSRIEMANKFSNKNKDADWTSGYSSGESIEYEVLNDFMTSIYQQSETLIPKITVDLYNYTVLQKLFYVFNEVLNKDGHQVGQLIEVYKYHGKEFEKCDFIDLIDDIYNDKDHQFVYSLIIKFQSNEYNPLQRIRIVDIPSQVNDFDGLRKLNKLTNEKGFTGSYYSKRLMNKLDTFGYSPVMSNSNAGGQAYTICEAFGKLVSIVDENSNWYDHISNVLIDIFA